MSLLGIDVGTTGTKAIIFNVEGAVLGESYREYPLIQPGQGLAELDSNVVWAAIRDAIREASARAGHGDPVRALGIACQGEAATPIDDKGRILGTSIVSFDNRTQEQSLWWEDNLARPRSAEYTNLISRENDYYWTVNQAELHLQQTEEPGSLLVQIATETPNFKTFQVRLDGGSWQERPSEFTWELHEGENTLEARPVNTFGRPGVVSQAIVSYDTG